MRSDESLQKATNAKSASPAARPNFAGIPPAFKAGASLSGHERNHLFLSSEGQRFDDVSGVSGLDHDGDSRVSVFFDFDRDGRSDVALVNSNAPLFQVFRNRTREAATSSLIEPTEASPRAIQEDIDSILNRDSTDYGFVAVRFVGGNHTSQPLPGKSPRDGIGATVRVQVGDRTLMRVRNCGEGFAGQNSSTMLIGIGARATTGKLSVTWPGGTVQEIPSVVSGALLTVYETPEQSPTGEAFVVAPYGPPILMPAVAPPAVVAADVQLPVNAGKPAGRLRMYTTMATWCPNCKRDIPAMRELREAFAASELTMYGVPVDPKDDAAKLASYVESSQPAYELLTDRTQAVVDRVVEIGRQHLGGDGLPMTLVLDANDNVRLVRWGTPTVSELRKLLR